MSRLAQVQAWAVKRLAPSDAIDATPLINAVKAKSSAPPANSSAEDSKALPPALSTPLLAWLDELALRQYSAHTYQAYARVLMAFGRYLLSQNDKLKDAKLKNDKPKDKAQGRADGANNDLGDSFGAAWQTNRQTLENYIAERLESGDYQLTSAKQALSALAQFYDHLARHNPAIHNPTVGFKLKKAPERLPTIADVDVMHQLLDQACPDDPDKARLWVRDRAIFELMYSSGLRVGEVASLNVEDVDLSAGAVTVVGKGNKMRRVPVGKKACQAISAYLPHRDLWQEHADPALFISERLGTRLTTRSIQLRIKAFAQSAGIAQDMYPHLLRHCFASHMLSASGDLRAVQEMLGHANASTTQIYTHVDFMALTRTYDKAHPRAQKSTQTNQAPPNQIQPNQD